MDATSAVFYATPTGLQLKGREYAKRDDKRVKLARATTAFNLEELWSNNARISDARKRDDAKNSDVDAKAEEEDRREHERAREEHRAILLAAAAEVSVVLTPVAPIQAPDTPLCDEWRAKQPA